MTYRLYVYNKLSKEYEAKGDYKTRQMAETKSEPFIKKGREIKITLLPTSELKVGMEIYKSDGELYAVIVDEDNSFWYLRRESKEADDRAFFLKDSFVEKYENGTFIMKEELDDKN